MSTTTSHEVERSELTLRGLILGILITLVFTAANVYFGLKAGLTFATSIPAAVISMALLRRFSGSSVQENNIVQTVASSAGTLSSIIFVLPGLVMIGWWNGFPYFVTCAICALGGVLGVMYSIPLRRALVTNSDLPYPEGVACAEVLKVGASNEAAAAEANRAGLLAIVAGSLASAAFAVVVATQVFAGEVVKFFRLGDKGGASGYNFSLSFALLAVGHLVGLWVGVAILVGALIAWAGAVPYLSGLQAAGAPVADIAALATQVWSKKVRFIGAGAIGVAAIWTLLKLIKPVATGLHGAIMTARVRKSGQAASLPRTERDIPIGWVGIITALCMLPIAWLLGDFSTAAGLGSQTALLVIGGVAYVVLMSFFVAAVCGYMAGLIGSSNSPLSGVGIIVVIGAALMLAFVAKPLLPASAGPALVAFALFVTSVVFAVATIANDNLQDLKTGQLVDATPWRQQVALIVGVLAGAVVIPPILDLLNKAYGFAGAPGADAAHALAAPQAALISALAKGVIQGDLDWNLIAIGAGIGAVTIFIDAVLKQTGRAHLPPLAVGLGIYLPTSSTLMIVVGAIAGWLFDKRAERGANAAGTKQLGVLLASGLIVGESLIGVLLAAIVVFSGQGAPLALVGEGFAGAAVWIGGGAFLLLTLALYGWVSKLGAAKH
ncbi:oligopeptide transporter, OPT family [Paucibacter sp. APW11]|uniref:Oligopeptide transporter, OPT family n=1 Tax=Roseateles aquae TaxID=3077235 RepID=A0ABU3PEU5_9BURK|nr:oligopeptide transporter, OPT family [Paucibacter sp. APW11]MDT9000421.1 oligopeptide transporter, OPT family [Paucibacter sp. APW11]